MYGHRGANRTRSCDMAAEFHQVGMAYYSIRYVDRKSVSRITASALCEKDEIPRTIVGGSGFGCRRQSEAGTTEEVRDQSLVHHHFSPKQLVDVQGAAVSSFDRHEALARFSKRRMVICSQPTQFRSLSPRDPKRSTHFLEQSGFATSRPNETKLSITDCASRGLPDL
jgi:hypothetical protein